jgi:hypothetical protein
MPCARAIANSGPARCARRRSAHSAALPRAAPDGWAAAQVQVELPHALPLRAEPYFLTLYLPAPEPHAPAPHAADACPSAAGRAGPAAGPANREGLRAVDEEPASGAPGLEGEKILGTGPEGGATRRAEQAGPPGASEPSVDMAAGPEPGAEGTCFLVPADDAAAADPAALWRRARAAAAELLNHGPALGARARRVLYLAQPGGVPTEVVWQGGPAAGAGRAGESPGAGPAGGAGRGAERARPARRLNASRAPAEGAGVRGGGAGAPADPGPGPGGGGAAGRGAEPALRDRAHKLQAWFGADVFALLEPGSFSRVCLDEQARRLPHARPRPAPENIQAPQGRTCADTSHCWPRVSAMCACVVGRARAGGRCGERGAARRRRRR